DRRASSSLKRCARSLRRRHAVDQRPRDLIVHSGTWMLPEWTNFFWAPLLESRPLDGRTRSLRITLVPQVLATPELAMSDAPTQHVPVLVDEILEWLDPQ